MLQERLGRSMMSIELNPPEKNKLTETQAIHEKHLSKLFSDLPELGAINLPEIQEEQQKGDKGDRKSSFKDRVPPRNYTLKLRNQFKKEYLINRVIVQEPPADQEAWLLETYHDYNLRSVVLVGGESSNRDYPGPSVPEGNRLIKDYLNRGTRQYGSGSMEPTDFLVGNICISTRRRSDFDEPERMTKKIEAGCDFFTSQIIAESETPARLIRDLSRTLKEKPFRPPPILWSLTPINSPKDVNFLRWLGVKIPDRVENKILNSDRSLTASLDHFERIWKELLEVEQELDASIPMGLNISPVALRNLEPSLKLASRLYPYQRD